MVDVASLRDLAHDLHGAFYRSDFEETREIVAKSHEAFIALLDEVERLRKELELAEQAASSNYEAMVAALSAHP